MGNNRHVFRAIAIAVVVLAGAAFIGSAAYNAGVSHAIAMSARAVEAPATPAAAGAPYPYPPYYAYGWHRPWGFGIFPLFPIFPILFVLFFFFVVRGLFWRGPWRGGWGGGGGVPPAFEEWHRRAHAHDVAASPLASADHGTA